MHLHIISRADAKRAGLKYYFTGKPCKHGHVSERKSVNGDCYACFFEKMYSYRDEAFSKKAGLTPAEYRQRLQSRKLEKIAGMSHPDYISKQDAMLRGQDTYFDAVKCAHGHLSPRYVSTGACIQCGRNESRKAWRTAYAKNNRESINRNCRNWSAKNKEKINCSVRNRRARIRKNGGTHNAGDILRILESQKFKCASCQCCVATSYQVDHIMPLALGGSNAPDNLQILCPTCNKRKSAKHPIDWAQENGRLL